MPYLRTQVGCQNIGQFVYVHTFTIVFLCYLGWRYLRLNHPLTSTSATVAAAAAATLATISPIVSTNTVRLLEVDDDSLGGFGVGVTGAALVFIPGIPSDDCTDIYFTMPSWRIKHINMLSDGCGGFVCRKRLLVKLWPTPLVRNTNRLSHEMKFVVVP